MKYQEKFLKYFKINDNENTTYQNVWLQQKPELRGKFTALNIYVHRRKI